MVENYFPDRTFYAHQIPPRVICTRMSGNTEVLKSQNTQKADHTQNTEQTQKKEETQNPEWNEEEK